MTYRYPLPPSANKYWRPYRGRMVVSSEAAAYKRTVAMLARRDGVTQITGPVALRVAIYRGRRSGDLDNFLKILIDALQGVFYVNDAQIVTIHATLHDDRHDPHCEVTVTRLKGDNHESGSERPGA